MSRVRSLVVAIAACASLWASSAGAESSFEVSPAVDGAITATSALVGVGLLGLRMSEEPSTRCVDKLCGGRSDGARGYDATFATFSDAALIATMAGALSPSFSRLSEDRYRPAGLGETSFMWVEALAGTMALTEAAKSFVPRYRPFLAFPPTPGGPSRSSPDADASFWSGHAALAFAAAAVGTFDACRADTPIGCVGPAVGLHALAISTGAGRVLAGKHHVSDVIVGAVMGGLTGSVVALTHAPSGRERGRDGAGVVMASQGFMLSMTLLW